MIRSMTAFSRQERQAESATLAVEIRSVNHRFLDLSVRLPDELRSLEPALRERVSRTVGRGKVECTLRLQAGAGQNQSLELNHDLAQRLAHLTREVDALLYEAAPVSSLDLLKWPGVLVVPSVDQERLQQLALDLLTKALAEFDATRQREGAKLAELIRQRCHAVAEILPKARQRAAEGVERQRTRLRERFEELRAEIDPARLEQELVLFAQRIDVTEELDRLDTHVAEVLRVLDQNEPVGRRLDFLMQELNREANTLASKSVDSESTRYAVDLKVLIEQMREQVQNIE